MTNTCVIFTGRWLQPMACKSHECVLLVSFDINAPKKHVVLSDNSLMVQMCICEKTPLYTTVSCSCWIWCSSWFLVQSPWSIFFIWCSNDLGMKYLSGLQGLCTWISAVSMKVCVCMTLHVCSAPLLLLLAVFILWYLNWTFTDSAIQGIKGRSYI